MKNLKQVHLSVLMVIQVFIICGITHISTAEEQQGGSRIKASNTIFIENFSDMLYNDVRTEHETIGDKPSIYLNEKFQLFFLFKSNKLKNSSSGDESVPASSSSYLSANFICLYDENYAARVGTEIEWGLRDYKNPFISVGLGLTNMNDMVFNYTKSPSPTFFFHIGYKENMHLFFEGSGEFITFADANLDYKDYANIDIALGYKKISPLFIRYNFNETESAYLNPEDKQYIYHHTVTSIHLQYYGDYYGISTGYTGNKEEYHYKDYNIAAVDTDKKRIGYRKSHGGGATFYIRKADSPAEFSGEFHLLTDSGTNWMAISKLGVKLWF